MASFADAGSPDFGSAIERLVAFYGPLPHPPTDPFAFYVWEVLGTKTTPGRRDTALNALRRIPAMTPESLRRVGRGRLETIVRQCGPFVDERLSALDAGIDVFRRQRDFTGRLKARLRLAWLSSRDLPHLGHAGALRLLLSYPSLPLRRPRPRPMRRPKPTGRRRKPGPGMS